MSDINPDLRERLVKIETLIEGVDSRLDDLVEGVQKVNKLEIEMSQQISALKSEITSIKTQTSADISKQTLMIRLLFGLVALGGGGLSAFKLIL